ncbi:MAG TPA: bifunctional serine/threonine-protein kinase/formylglycine-generating enzyme family protein [Pyrinomonadaceae bacterium]|jgi:serine/threonine-protein kinase
MIGQIVGSYKIIEKIGEGGMGAVFKGVDMMLEREVAVKVLRPELASQPQVVERFRSEAVTLAKLNHPNVAILYSFFRQSSYFFMVLEYVKGQTLDKIIEARGAMSCEQAIPLFCQMLEGIEHAHRFGIIHRDIKPANMMLTEGGLLKVLDFGIARVLGSARLTRAGHLIGTIEYMSPEQVRGLETDARSDIYSLGMVLYEMLTGRVPFASNSEFELMKAQVEQTPPPPREFAPHIPEDIEWAILCATAKDPEKRFQTASAFRAAIVDSLITDSPATARLLPPSYGWDTGRLNASPIAVAPSSQERSAKLPQPTRMAGSGDTLPTPSATPTNSLQTVRKHKLFWPLLGGVVLLLGISTIVLLLALAEGARGSSGTATESQNIIEAQLTHVKAKTLADAEAAINTTPPPGMAYVPGGEFMMGRDMSNGGDEYESPAHRVSVNPFFMDIYEVTCEDYDKFIKATGHAAPPGWTGGKYAEGASRKPVTGVTWVDANAYAKWAGKRLPTEEEWEFAARGTDGRLYPWGNEWQDDLANAGSKNKGMVDVGEYKGASPFGVFDMVGNAWEWTTNDFEGYPGGQVTEKKSGLKVIRGGYWGSAIKTAATTTYRAGLAVSGEKDYGNTGFRCVKDIRAHSASQ